eukprot:9239147-Alexandrium_andersonii.AAC.1
MCMREKLGEPKSSGIGALEGRARTRTRELDALNRGRERERERRRRMALHRMLLKSAGGAQGKPEP